MHSLSTTLPRLVLACIPFVGGCDLGSKSVGTPDDGATDDGGTSDGATDDGGTSDGATDDGATGGGATTGSEDETVALCIVDNPQTGTEADWGTDYDCPQPPPGQPGVECPDPVTQATMSCDAEGVDCDPDAFITRDAALCLAAAADLDPGLNPWLASLTFHYGYLQPVWVVRNTTVQDGVCYAEGTALTFDGTTGELLETSMTLMEC